MQHELETEGTEERDLATECEGGAGKGSLALS